MKTVYYAITPSWNIVQKFTSKKEADTYLEKYPSTFHIIYREEGINDYEPFHIYK